MKRLILALVLMAPGAAFADEPFFGTEKAAAVLNGPGAAVAVGKAATNVVQPAVEQLYDFGGEWRTGISAAVWTYSREEVPLAAVRAGYASDYLPYVSAPVDLKNVTARYILPALPDQAEGWLGAGPLDMAWSAIGKYGVLGPWAGYNFDKHEDGNNKDGGLVYGVSVGAKLTF